MAAPSRPGATSYLDIQAIGASATVAAIATGDGHVQTPPAVRQAYPTNPTSTQQADPKATASPASSPGHRPMTAPVVTEQIVLAIDPGLAKCGVAVVRGPEDISCLHRGVVDALRLTIEVGDLIRRYPDVGKIVIGSGTGSAPLRKALAASFPNIPVEAIDEHRSSERGRARYLAENVPYRWRHLVPPDFRTPDRPYDDYVALILAEDYFRQSDPSK